MLEPIGNFVRHHIACLAWAAWLAVPWFKGVDSHEKSISASVLHAGTMGSMIMSLRLGALAAGLATALGLTAAAIAADDAALCKDFRAPPDAPIAACDRVIAAKKTRGRELATIYLKRGKAHGRKGQNDRALEDIEQAIKLAPAWGEAYGERGNLYMELHDGDRAMASFDEALRYDRNLAWVYVSRSSLWNARGNQERALADANEATRANPKEATAYGNRGSIYLLRFSGVGFPDVEVRSPRWISC